MSAAKPWSTTYKNLWYLRITTVILPLAFLVAFSYVSHFLLSSFTHSLHGFVFQMAVLALVISLFSYSVFRWLAKAEYESRRRTQELLVLKTVAVAASLPMNLQDLLQVAADDLVVTLGVQGSLVYVLDDRTQKPTHVAFRDIPMHCVEPLTTVMTERGSGGIPHAVGAGKRLCLYDLTQDLNTCLDDVKARFHSLLGIALESESRMMGGIVLASNSPLALEHSRIQFVIALGSQLAAAIEKAHLHLRLADVAVLEERERIAREMHDGLAQVLGYINAKTSAISRLIADGDVEHARSETADLRASAQELYKDVREAILGLRLSGARAGTLANNLREYCQNFSDLSGMETVIVGDNEAVTQGVDMAVDIQVRRIVQEALTNVRKHAQANKVTLSLGRDDKSLCVRVEDDGIGFCMAALQANGRHHFGIQTMRERAASVGGDLQVESVPGSGTTVAVTVPLLAKRGEA